MYEQQGSGLGLLIAKRLVELHGGEFSIESIYGAQTIMRIVLPQ
jgi:signal transduction histidine kinase